jgi:hypothetical protein
MSTWTGLISKAGQWRARNMSPAPAHFVVGLSVFGLVISLLLYWPGNVSSDMIGVWYDARTSHIAVPHGLLMSFLWRWLDMLLPGPGLMLAAQLLVFWSGLALLLLYFRPSKIAAIICGVALATNPFVLAFEGSLLPDVFAANLALLGYMLLLTRLRTRAKIALVILAFCSFGLAALVRYQVCVVALPALVGVVARSGRNFGAVRYWDWQTGLIGLAALLLCIAGGRTTVYESFDVSSHFFDMNLRYAMLYDIAAIIEGSHNLPLHVFAANNVDVDELRHRALRQYTPYRHDPLSLALDRDPRDTAYVLLKDLPTGLIARQWFDVISSAPLDFLQSRLERFGIFLGLGDVYACGPRDFLGMSHVPRAKWIALGRPEPPLPYANAVMKSRMFPAGTLLFRPISYLAVSIVVVIVTAYTQALEAVIVYGLVAAAWLYWLTFAPLPIACDIRYSFFSCASVMFSIAIWLLSPRPSPLRPVQNIRNAAA